MKVGKYTVIITNPNKVWFVDPVITKGEVVAYFHKIAPRMLSSMKDRPLTMQRFPEGSMHEGFYHKDAPSYFPAWIKRFKVKKKENGFVNYVIVDKVATVVYLANFGCITPHLFLSTTKKINYPDQIIFDLDPPDNNFELVRQAALDLRELLLKVGLVPFVKTTGSRGLHVVVPIKPQHSFDEVRAFAHAVAHLLVQQNPRQRTLEIRTEKRRGRLFIDVMRNAFGQTAVAPYSVRARPGAPVATPLHWHELHNKKLRSDMFTIKNIFQRLKKIQDPWKDLKRSARTIRLAQKKLQELEMV